MTGLVFVIANLSCTKVISECSDPHWKLIDTQGSLELIYYSKTHHVQGESCWFIENTRVNNLKVVSIR